MKKIFLFILVFSTTALHAQFLIRDKNITNQQERMVFKQWSRKKFTPTSGWLGLNPEYWLTWAWHPDYPRKDLRPLGPIGPQTQRLALAAAMKNSLDLYKLHTDTLRNTALIEAVNYSAVAAEADPLWQLFYRHEFKPLIQENSNEILKSLSEAQKEYLLKTGVYECAYEASNNK